MQDDSIHSMPTSHNEEFQTLNFEFRGSAFEYFKIWIVNTVLTILTLGIFSAWAKVRSKRYLLGNTYLAGQNFEYLADPIKILKGRLIIGLLFILYVASSYLHPYLALTFLGLLILMTPYIIIKSLAFNLTYTSHRNIRFSLQKDFVDVYKIFLIWAPLSLISLYLAFPAGLRRFYNHIFQRMTYGDTAFQFKNSESLYPIYLGAAFLQIAIAIGFGGLVFIVQLAASSVSATLMLSGSDALIKVGLTAAVFAFYGSTFYTYAVLRAWTFEYFARQLSISKASIKSQVGAGELGLINFSNFLLIIFTLGLATPWAIIRYRRYVTEKMSLEVPSAKHLDEFASSQSQNESTEGDAAGDIFDIDFDFGF